MAMAGMDPLMDAPLEPAMPQPQGGESEDMAAAAFEVAIEYLPMVPTPLLEQSLVAMAGEMEQRMGAQAPQAPQAMPMGAQPMPMAAEGIAGLV